MKLDFNDILIKPSEISTINSRTDINPFDYNGFLPVITAPMDTVVGEINESIYIDNKVNVCMPRYEHTNHDQFISYSLNDVITKLNNGDNLPNKLLIDVANGHMNKVLYYTILIKTTFPGITLMVGNVANPKTYTKLSEAGADYIRVGIGNGNGCLTTQQTGVGYPMASLIKNCYQESLTLNNPAKIVADGGMKKYSDIIKALALGADYVMVGSLFSKSIDSCGEYYLTPYIPISRDIAGVLYDYKLPIYKNFRGMSTKEVQKKWGNKILKTSEGVSRKYKVEYSIESWINNFKSYLTSAMSYSNAKELSDFIGKADTITISNNSFNRFKK